MLADDTYKKNIKGTRPFLPHSLPPSLCPSSLTHITDDLPPPLDRCRLLLDETTRLGEERVALGREREGGRDGWMDDGDGWIR